MNIRHQADCYYLASVVSITVRLVILLGIVEVLLLSATFLKLQYTDPSYLGKIAKRCSTINFAGTTLTLKQRINPCFEKLIIVIG
jgi:hypothetical protein